MARVLVVYGSRHGGTRGIAERIGEVLRSDGLEAVVSDAAAAPSTDGFDAFVVGSGVYLGTWLKEATSFLEREATRLAGRPVYLFSSGPLPGSTRSAKTADVEPLEESLGPVAGPGSGGRRKVEELSALVRPREHRVFLGAFDPSDPPRTIVERVVRLVPAPKKILPAGDFREWEVIEAWAHEIAREVARGFAVAGAV